MKHTPLTLIASLQASLSAAQAADASKTNVVILLTDGSIDKARRRIDYQLRYSSLQAAQEAVSWLIASGRISLGR